MSNYPLGIIEEKAPWNDVELPISISISISKDSKIVLPHKYNSDTIRETVKEQVLGNLIEDLEMQGFTIDEFNII